MRPLVLFVILFAAASFACAQTPSSSSCGVTPAVAATDADKAFAAGSFAEAETLYAAKPGAAIGLVHAQLEQNKLHDALASARKAADADPSNAAFQALVAETLLRSGDINAATTVLGKALTLDKCSARALFVLASYNQLISKRASAASQLATAHKLAPGDAQIAAAWVLTLAPDAQADAVKALLASSPTLAPRTVAALSTAAAIDNAHATCTATWPEKPVSMDLWGNMIRGTHARSYGIKMRVGTADIANVEVDSGVSGIVLNPRDAKNAGVHPLAGAPAAANGTYYATVDSIRVGAAEFHNCPVRVTVGDTLGRANSLIGTDFFRDRLIHLDYIDRRMILTAPAAAAVGLADRMIPPAEKDWSIAYMAGGDILLPTFINTKGPFLTLFDTGAFTSIYAPVIGDGHPVTYKETLFPMRGSSTDIVKAVPDPEQTNNIGPQIAGPDGKFITVSNPVKLPNLRFYGNDRLDLDPISFDITPKSQDAGVEIAALLGFSVIHDYTVDIDYRNGLVKLLYDQQHRYSDRELNLQH